MAVDKTERGCVGAVGVYCPESMRFKEVPSESEPD